MLRGLSKATLEGYGLRATEYLTGSIQRAGGVVNSLLGINAQGAATLAVLPEGAAGGALKMETLALPGPFRDFQDVIQKAFAERSIQAALFWGEAWTFPPEGPEAIKRHVREGLMPSQHPNRQEIVFLSTHWPRGGIGSMSVWRIVRPPTGPYLRPLWEHKDGDPANNILTFVSSWVDEVLPQPLPGE